MMNLPIHYAEVETIYSQTIGAGYRSIAVTSAVAGEGKTSLAEALVKRAHIVDKKVLLVEMNTFNPVISERLRQLQLYTHQDNQVFAIEQQGFSFLPAPQKLKNVLKYRESNLLRTSITQWLNEFDCIVFDTAPLTALNQSNISSEVICEVCDGTVLIVEAGKTPANMIQESIEKLKTKKANLIGSVINDKSNPSLLTEMLRESARLNCFFPKLMQFIRTKLSQMVLLKVSV